MKGTKTQSEKLKKFRLFKEKHLNKTTKNNYINGIQKYIPPAAKNMLAAGNTSESTKKMEEKRKKEMAQLGGERVHKEERWLNGSVSDSNAVVPGSNPAPPQPRANSAKSLGGLAKYRIMCWPLRGDRSTSTKNKQKKPNKYKGKKDGRSWKNVPYERKT